MQTFWWLLTVVSLVWYSTITVFVGVRGVWDIKNMLARLSSLENEEADTDAPPPNAQ